MSHRWQQTVNNPQVCTLSIRDATLVQEVWVPNFLTLGAVFVRRPSCLAPAWNGWTHHEAIWSLYAASFYTESLGANVSFPYSPYRRHLKCRPTVRESLLFFCRIRYNAWNVGGTVPRTRKSVGGYAYSESYPYDVNGCNSFSPQYFQLLIHWLLMILHAVFCLQITCLLMIFIVN